MAITNLSYQHSYTKIIGKMTWDKKYSDSFICLGLALWVFFIFTKGFYQSPSFLDQFSMVLLRFCHVLYILKSEKAICMINRTDFLMNLSSPWVNVFISTNNCGWLLFPHLNYHPFWPELLLRIRIKKPQLIVCERPGLRECVVKVLFSTPKRCILLLVQVFFLQGKTCLNSEMNFVLSLHFAWFVLDLSFLIAVFPVCNLKPKPIGLWTLHDTLK